MKGIQAQYDEINLLDPGDIIAGHNGQDSYANVQRAECILKHRRLGKICLPDVMLSKSASTFYPVEMLIIDQYDNVYYMMHAVLSDSDIYTYCDRVRTIETKKGYELGAGWDVVLRKYRALGFESILKQQKLILN